MTENLESEVHRSNIGVIVNGVSGIVKTAATFSWLIGTCAYFDWAKKHNIPEPAYILGMVAGLQYLMFTGAADIALAWEKYKNHRQGKTQFNDRSEDPSRISSSSLDAWRVLGAVEQAYFD